jgi:protein arginine N-methyltransferase 1
MINMEYHRNLLADQQRISAFQKAIEEVVQPGDVVLDLGAGTGILSFLACRAGASRVYAIEAGEIIEVAKEICRTNGFEDQMIFLGGRSHEVELPEKVDVVIADQLGPFGVDAGILEYFSDARKRFLKSNGLFVPFRIELYLAPVHSGELWRRIEMWNNSFAGFDFEAAYQAALHSVYPFAFSEENPLGSPVRLMSIAPGSVISELPMTGSIKIEKSGILHGIAGWFSAHLSPNVVISNSPLESKPISRTNLFFPIPKPLPVNAGDSFVISVCWKETGFDWHFSNGVHIYSDKSCTT